MTRTIKPLARPGYTMFNNYILDHMMPDLSHTGWKVLCVAIRKTIGWADKSTVSGRKEEDRISYSQFKKYAGIGSDATVSKALKECLEKGYLIRMPAWNHAQQYDYSLNMDYTVEVDETTSENEEVLVTTSENEEVLVTTSDSEEVLTKTTSESEDTKERLKKGAKQRKKEPPQTRFYIAECGAKVEY